MTVRGPQNYFLWNWQVVIFFPPLFFVPSVVKEVEGRGRRWTEGMSTMMDKCLKKTTPGDKGLTRPPVSANVMTGLSIVNHMGMWKKYFSTLIPDIHSEWFVDLLINRVSPWDHMTCEARHTPVCLQVGTPYPLFKLFIINRENQNCKTQTRNT